MQIVFGLDPIVHSVVPTLPGHYYSLIFAGQKRAELGSFGSRTNIQNEYFESQLSGSCMTAQHSSAQCSGEIVSVVSKSPGSFGC